MHAMETRREQRCKLRPGGGVCVLLTPYHIMLCSWVLAWWRSLHCEKFLYLVSPVSLSTGIVHGVIDTRKTSNKSVCFEG